MACSFLTDQELLLFSAMPGRDRRHSMDMVHWLQRQPPEDGSPPSPELLAAALVHDVGKGSLIVWDRVAFVLLGAASTRLRIAAGVEHGPRWRHAIWRLEHHAQLGADLLQTAGSRPRVVELVRRHKDHSADGDVELHRLIAADGAC